MFLTCFREAKANVWVYLQSNANGHEGGCFVGRIAFGRWDGMDVCFAVLHFFSKVYCVY